MFNSKHVNTDREPFAVYVDHKRTSVRARPDDEVIVKFDADVDLAYDPRPEYDNRPNPLLLAFRADVDDAHSDNLKALYIEAWTYALAAFTAFGGTTAWDGPRHVYHVFTTVTQEEVEHFSRVLELLTVLWDSQRSFRTDL